MERHGMMQVKLIFVFFFFFSFLTPYAKALQDRPGSAGLSLGYIPTIKIRCWGINFRCN